MKKFSGFKDSPAKQDDTEKDMKKAFRKIIDKKLSNISKKPMKHIKPPKVKAGEGFMRPPYKKPVGPTEKRKAYHGYKNFKSILKK